MNWFVPIDVFSFYVLFLYWRSHGNLPIVFSEIMRTFALEEDEIWKKQFSRVLSLDLENKT